jgi:hypothetical protein
MNRFVRYDDWFTKKYFDKLDNRYRHGRFHTFKAALNLLSQRCPEDALIIETGCQRELDDWGAGCSTQIFADYLDHYGGRLISVDNNPEHIARSKTFVNSNHVGWVKSDSETYLSSFWKNSAHSTPGLLYLDSFDYPYGILLDTYGGKVDLDMAIEVLWSKKEEDLVAEFKDVITPCQEHCLKEIQAAPLSTSTIVLIDDASLPGGGKARLAKEWLASNGWVCILDLYQTLWIKG